MEGNTWSEIARTCKIIASQKRAVLIQENSQSLVFQYTVDSIQITTVFFNKSTRNFCRMFTGRQYSKASEIHPFVQKVISECHDIPRIDPVSTPNDQTAYSIVDQLEISFCGDEKVLLDHIHTIWEGLEIGVLSMDSFTGFIDDMTRSGLFHIDQDGKFQKRKTQQSIGTIVRSLLKKLG